MDARTLATAEMRRGDALVGTLTVLTTGAVRRFSAGELELLGRLADHAAQAITNARLHAVSEAQATANARLNATIQRRLRNVRALHAIDNAILTSRSRDAALDVVLAQACAELNVDVALVWLADGRTPRLLAGPSRGLSLGAGGRRLAQGALAGRAADERQPVWRSVAAADLGAPHLAAEGVAFVAAAPLIANGALLGVLEVAHRAAREPDSEWLAFLATLAGQAAIAVDYLRALEDLARANGALVAAYDETLAGWARALDLRDHDTAGHCERVTELTVRLARAWGMPEEELTQVRRGALLHDIGKLGVPDAILLKPDRLSAEEEAVMRLHPRYAHEWLAPIAFLRPALDIPYAHHEKWDGSGYPRGLRGEAIPLAARLFAVVDVWDALTSDRPYRPAWAPERALAYLQANTGTHFDPQVVAAFREMIAAEGGLERAVGS
jgi:HD-GYP domain-containing protein (c-di-GMP phosphodiesterase class II)